jgi:glycosyltransferase involved in cell wall biosynthesis
MTISAVIITRNEEANLERCLRSLAWVDEIVVVDSGSTDRTVEIARGVHAKVLHREWCGFGPAKQYALEQATGEWILSVDADEEISATLKDEIVQAVGGAASCAGYYLPRRTQFLGRWIRHSGWYPDYVLRLFKRDGGRFTEALVHEKVEVAGTVGRLTNPILHYSYPTLEAYLRKLDHYSTLSAQRMFDAGKRSWTWGMTVKPAAAFVRKYLFQQGWRDGWEGFLIATLTATGTRLKYAKLRSLSRDAAATGKR